MRRGSGTACRSRVPWGEGRPQGFRVRSATEALSPTSSTSRLATGGCCSSAQTVGGPGGPRRSFGGRPVAVHPLSDVWSPGRGSGSPSHGAKGTDYACNCGLCGRGLDNHPGPGAGRVGTGATASSSGRTRAVPPGSVRQEPVVAVARENLRSSSYCALCWGFVGSAASLH